MLAVKLHQQAPLLMGVYWKCAICMHLNIKIIHLSGIKSEFHVYISLNIIKVGELTFHKQISPISRGNRFVSGFLSIRRSLTHRHSEFLWKVSSATFILLKITCEQSKIS